MRWLTTLFCVLVLACSSAAQSQSETKTPAQSFVWRVAGTHNTVYLAGSMHLLPESAYPLPDAFDESYADAAILVEEADQDALQSDRARQAMLAGARYDQGDLQSHLDAAMYQRTAEVLESLGLSMNNMRDYRPWFVSMAIEVNAFQAVGFRPDLGLDGYYHDKAIRDAKPILALQTLVSHLAVVTDMPEALSRDQLAVTLDNADELDTAPHELYDFWRNGNADGLAASVDEQVQAYPALYDRLIFDRNAVWMKTLEALLNSPQNAMVLVGAAHLVGPRGLVARLRDAGYDVERMP